ncbi:polysaccharide pyruvyl transferase family protein [Salegentibacter sediminis]|uniref:polysaccharide pyruvyl transferase family protein n=1 Tax=Salegentibacter sediminis TaxID=1930251 RepID=UPI0009BC99FF|nr:polysaccharide pyruvyl transferase family protein [Salegentibacter sediminis]
MFHIKKSIRRFQYSINDLIYPNAIKIDYAVKKNNFGDILNPIVVEYLTDKKTKRVATAYTNKTHLLGIGSILNRANKNSIVWGAGFIKDKSFVIGPPKKILAVRGPKTRKRLLELNIECPEIYGDPALLMPNIYNPKIDKKYKLGIIPHYVDFNDDRLKHINDDNVLVIDICNPDPFLVIDQLLRCEKVASSSLHGLIVSDAYGIPNAWIKFSDKVVGGDFKFLDYFQSIDRATKTPYDIGENIIIKDLIDNCNLHKVRLNLRPLTAQIKKEYSE